MCTICSALRPFSDTCDYEDINASSAEAADAADNVQTDFAATNTGTNEMNAVAGASAAGNLDEMAKFLTDGYWGGTGHHFDTSADNTITINLNGLTAEGRQLARWAFEAWESVADLNFVETSSGGADITLDDNKSGSSASYTTLGAYTNSASVNVSTNWLASYGTTMGSYSFQTYMHEIGHALGLGHQGNYSGSASYGKDATFANDSWQMSVMSYFSQTDNTAITASRAETVSVMMADVLAMQNMYGVADSSSLTAGDTTYGVGHTLGKSWLGQLYSAMNGTGASSVYDGGTVALTISDVGGYDLLDYSNGTSRQKVDLRAEGISNVDGATGNLMIARGTVIEAFNAGSGHDTVQGNAANNKLWGNDGNDTLIGGGGRDALYGGTGRDTLQGDTGKDLLTGGAGADILNGGDGRDMASYLGATAGVTANLADSSENTGEASGDTYSSIEDLRGSVYRDVLDGNTGKNTIDGRGGADRMFGRGRDDVLIGGGGNDRLEGGKGNDTLTGGANQDTFVFKAGHGHDVITDYGDGNDRLKLDGSLWGNANLSTAKILNFASVVNGDTVFDFGGGDTMTLENYTDIAGLGADLIVF